MYSNPMCCLLRAYCIQVTSEWAKIFSGVIPLGTTELALFKLTWFHVDFEMQLSSYWPAIKRNISRFGFTFWSLILFQNNSFQNEIHL